MSPRALIAFGLLLFSLNVTSFAAETTQFAYGVNAGDWSLTQYRVNPETGVLRHNGHIPVYKYPVALAIHPSNRFLITAVRTGNKVAVHRINSSTGKLTEIPQSPFNAGASSPYSVSIHPSGRFVYVAARWGGVVAYSMDEQSGVLTLIPGSPFPAQKRTRSVKVHPSGQFVYATNAHSNSISAYRVNEKTGVLNQITGSPFNTGEKGELPPDMLHVVDAPPEAGGIPFRVEIHPSGNYLFVTNRYGFSFSAFKVNTRSGVLIPLKNSPVQTGGLPYGITVHPSGRFIYVTSGTNNEVWAYRFDETKGQITPLPDSPFPTHGYAPISITFNAEGSQAYQTNVGSNSITQYSVNQDSGKLTLAEITRTRYQPFYTVLLDSEPVTTKDKIEIQSQEKPTVISPDGRFVYKAFGQNHKGEKGGIAVFRVNVKSRALTAIPELNLPLDFTPTKLVMDASGWNLYAVNPTVNKLGVYVVDPEKGAIKMPYMPAPPTGKGPAAIALDPAGRFSFVANKDENTVSVYTHIRMKSPAMNPINSSGSSFAVGKQPAALNVDPTGKFLIVANKKSNNISVFTIHYHKGLLEPVKGSPYKSGRSPVAVTFHPNGKFVYVLNADSGNISSYQVDPVKGELTKLNQSVTAGKQPEILRLGSEGRFAYVRNKGKSGFRKFAVNETNGKLKYEGFVKIKPVKILDK